MKPIITFLSLMCVALAAGLVWLYGTRIPKEQKDSMDARISSYSNQVEEARAKLGDQEKLAGYLQSNLTSQASELVTVSNQLTTVSTALAQAETQAREAQAETRKLTARITQVEGERDGLQTRLTQLAGEINTLNDQIAETKRKLAAAEGDRDFLTKELTRLQGDKAELVRQFNDVAAVRAQLALLREESAINQRLTWINQGVYQRAGMKGAQALVAKPEPALSANRPGLDVELHENNPRTPVTTTPESSAPTPNATDKDKAPRS